jgi:hypothetical protein
MTRERRTTGTLSGLALGAAVAGIIGIGAIAPSGAQAQEHRNWHRNWNHGHGWFGGYYRRPPIVYGSPYRQRYYVGPRYYAPRYYPPPVVYGPGLSFSFRFR